MTTTSIILTTVMTVMFNGLPVLAKEPSGCKIYRLNGTHFGEIWTPSVAIRHRVSLALRNPNPNPWEEINIEFESKSGAHVGTLGLKRHDPVIKFKLDVYSQTVHKKKEKSHIHKSHGSLSKLLDLQDWVYLNISTGGQVKISLNDSKTVFRHLHAKSFKSLYVRVPDGQDLDVAFNCGEAKTMKSPETSSQIKTKNSNMTLVIVVIILIALVIGIVSFWYIGKKKRDALLKNMEENGICEECGDPIGSEDSTTDDEEKLVDSKEAKVCDDCGEVITNEEDESE